VSIKPAAAQTRLRTCWRAPPRSEAQAVEITVSVTLKKSGKVLAILGLRMNRLKQAIKIGLSIGWPQWKL
jgi:hypothetical protein